MELLEYQAKELFKMVGIPTLPAQTIKDSRQIKQLQIPYPVVLKSQVRSGGRGKAGGVRFVANTIDAIAAARTIFNLAILGEYPEVILAEAHYNTEREFFLAIVLDYDLQCPVLLGSAYGGMNVDSLLANLQQVVVDTDFSLFYARRLAANMGLSGQLICSVSEIISKMYRLFIEKDLNIIEINPLGVNTKGKLMALDGKITINDSALGRQPIINSLNFSEHQKQNNSSLNYSFLGLQDQGFIREDTTLMQVTTLHDRSIDNLNKAGWYWLNWHNKKGKIATICNSLDLALLTWDLLNQNKVSPACGVVIDDPLSDREDDTAIYQKRLKQILTELESVEGLEVILINIWSTEAITLDIVKTISQYIQSSFRTTLRSQAEQVSDDLAAGLNKPQSNTRRVSTKSKQQNVAQDITQVRPKFILRLPNNNDFAQMDLNLFLDSDLGDCSKVEDILYISSELEEAIKQAILG